MRGYAYLSLAIVTEVCGTTLLKLSNGFTIFFRPSGRLVCLHFLFII